MSEAPDLSLSRARLIQAKEAVALLWTLDQSLRLGHIIRHHGDVYYDGGRAELAEPCYDEALAPYRGHEATEPLDLPPWSSRFRRKVGSRHTSHQVRVSEE